MTSCICPTKPDPWCAAAATALPHTSPKLTPSARHPPFGMVSPAAMLRSVRSALPSMNTVAVPVLDSHVSPTWCHSPSDTSRSDLTVAPSKVILSDDGCIICRSGADFLSPSACPYERSTPSSLPESTLTQSVTVSSFAGMLVSLCLTTAALPCPVSIITRGEPRLRVACSLRRPEGSRHCTLRDSGQGPERPLRQLARGEESREQSALARPDT
mmetsp:Transcript_32194/g.74924  ORF Transcript_32194/g.74924 Transcript_32194/m.74924 type:complete len:214 (+) Transcript_32194:1648-2289(+)